MGKDTHFSAFSINVQHNLVTFDRPAVMGILNVTPDSFFDGGRFLDPHAMVRQAGLLLRQGADILDVGVVSSRPGAVMPPPDVEAPRLAAAVAALRQAFPSAIISVDTCFALPARRAIEAGADMINDIGAGQFDADMFDLVADAQVPYVMMHTRGLPAVMQANSHYDDIIADITLYFSQRLDRLYRLGVKDVWIDPGFGFAKTLQQNFELLSRLDELMRIFPQPLLVGLSRKSMVCQSLHCTPRQALNGTTVLNTRALLLGARALRVHDPRQAREAVALFSL